MRNCQYLRIFLRKAIIRTIKAAPSAMIPFLASDPNRQISSPITVMEYTMRSHSFLVNRARTKKTGMVIAIKYPI